MWLPREPSEAVLWTINSPRGVNPNTIDETPEYISVLRRHETPFRGSEGPVPAPCRDGELPPGAISIDATASIIVVAASHDEEGVVLHRG